MSEGSEKPKETTSSARRSLALSFYTFLSRILGLIRDHFMAVSFGTGMVASAFSVAYRLPNMFRNLLAEGTLSQSFMPIFSEYDGKSREEARVMTGTVLSFLFLCLSLFVAVFWFVLADHLPKLVGGSPEYGALVVQLSLILFFLIMTASLSSIFMSISNSQHKYFIPSLSPIILNFSYLIVFIGIFPFVQEIQERVFLLAYGIILGGLCQLIVQMVYVYRLGYGPIFRLDIQHPAIQKIFRLMLPAALGGSFYQLGLLVDIFIANYIQNANPGLGAVVSLDYSQRLVQLPTGIIGVALATTILPSLLKDLRADQKENVPKEILDVLCFGFYLTIPAAIGLSILGESVLNAIYFGGRWDLEATHTAFFPLVFYSIAIPFYSTNKVLVSSYYAFQDTKTPLRVQFVAFLLSIALSLGLMFYLKHSAIALASAISAFSTSSLLLWFLKRHEIQIPWKSLFKRLKQIFVPILGLSLFLVVCEWYLKEYLFQYALGQYSVAMKARVYLSLSIGFSLVIYLLLSHWIRLPEAEIFLGRLFKKRPKK
ncbi:MviN-like protein [Leptospira ryugenii]|uniref:Probable lipid II flippase MurJ n=1 Tax=Leptospira ryugenii TaxID=1917863 RepID=A0A2P2DYJ0_9LEPT|nr:murein biosynthesis integral membrane protein MurJ [Leptospira ryugenii]GBF49682.1 MviN-like protein [Leptospira ryugenii]